MSRLADVRVNLYAEMVNPTRKMIDPIFLSFMAANIASQSVNAQVLIIMQTVGCKNELKNWW